MNFLAHVYLSQHPPELMVGNFIGDFVKGRAYENYSPVVKKGIILHREIDEFTDKNEWVRQSKQRLVPRYRHYSAVLVDMFYDHFLASNWSQYHDQSLNTFTRNCYDILSQFKSILPERANYMLPYMIKDNWLNSYAKISGISQALHGLSKRTRFRSNMEFAINELETDYEEFKKEFSLFFPILINHTDIWKKENGFN